MLVPPHPERAPPYPREDSTPVRARAHHREGSAPSQRRPRPVPCSALRLRRVLAQAPPHRHRPRPTRAPVPPSPTSQTREAAAGRGESWRPRSAAPSLTRSTGSESGRGHCRSRQDGQGRVQGAGASRQGGRAGLPEVFTEEEAHPGLVRAGPRSCGLHPDTTAALTSFPRWPGEIRPLPRPGSQNPAVWEEGEAARPGGQLGTAPQSPASASPCTGWAQEGGRGGWGLSQLVGRRWRGQVTDAGGSLSEATGDSERAWEKAQNWGRFVIISEIRSTGNLF